jgi:phosphatidylglycerophosphatase C
VNHRLLAAFDFDGTLTRRDTLLPFLVESCGTGAVAQALAQVAPLAVRAKAGRVPDHLHPRDAAKEALLHRLLAGRDADWLRQQGQSFEHTVPRRLRPEMVEQLRWHQDQGHEVVIVSASLMAYLQPFAQRMGISHVIAVEPEVGDDGILTGRLTGPNVRGPEKEVRLRHWLGDDLPEIMWAYGNSSGDRELLAMADVAIWVDGTHARSS